MSKQAGQLDSIDQLNSSLEEKDELIEALTLRLEKTVEELDRMRRSGVKSGSGGGGGSLPNELVDQQYNLAERLEEAVDNWQAAQPGEQLNRIEDGIYQLLSSLTNGEVAPPPERPPAQMTDAPAEASDASTPEAEDDFWAATKARLMGEEPAEASAESSPSTPEVSQQTAEVAAPVDASPSAPPATGEVVHFEEPDDYEPPKPVEPEADQEELAQAVEDRDAYIRYLTGRLRNEQRRKVGPIDWESLSQKPGDLGEQLCELEKMLQAQLKDAEISISLERASITRQRSKLYQVKRHLEKEIKRIGQPGETSGEDEKTGSRWGKIFTSDK